MLHHQTSNQSSVLQTLKKNPVNLSKCQANEMDKHTLLKLSCCLSQECLNKRTGERKGNYNSRREEEGRRGRGSPPSTGWQACLSTISLSLPLCRPPTSTHFKTLELKPHSQSSLSTTAHCGYVLRWRHDCALSYAPIRPAQLTLIQKERKQENLTYQATIYL